MLQRNYFRVDDRIYGSKNNDLSALYSSCIRSDLGISRLVHNYTDTLGASVATVHCMTNDIALWAQLQLECNIALSLVKSS